MCSFVVSVSKHSELALWHRDQEISIFAERSCVSRLPTLKVFLISIDEEKRSGFKFQFEMGVFVTEAYVMDALATNRTQSSEKIIVVLH